MDCNGPGAAKAVGPGQVAPSVRLLRPASRTFIMLSLQETSSDERRG